MLQSQLAQLSPNSKQDQNDSSGLETIGMSFSTLIAPFQAPNAWIVDSGATAHITCFLEFLYNFKPLTNKYVLLPNHTRVQVLGTPVL